MPLSPSELKKRLSKPPVDKGSQGDEVIARIAHLSQVGLLLLALFGYFYTVVPVYQKELLDEAIAQKTIELADKTKKLDDASSRLKALEKEYGAARADLADLNKRYIAAYDKLRFQSLLSLRSTLPTICTPSLFKELLSFTGKTLNECFREHMSNSYDMSALNADDRAAVAKTFAGLGKQLANSLAAFRQIMQQRHKELLAEQAKIDAAYKLDNESRLPDDLAATIPRGGLSEATDPRVLQWYIARTGRRAKLVDEINRIYREIVLFEINSTNKARDIVEDAVEKAFKPLLKI